MTSPFTCGAKATGPSGPVALDSSYTVESAELQMGHFITALEEIYRELSDHLPNAEYIDAIDDPAYMVLRTALLDETAKDVISVEGIGDKLRSILEYAATTLNKVGTTISKLLMTGYPFFEGMIKRATAIKEMLKTASPQEKELAIKGFSQLVVGDHFATRDELLQQVELMGQISHQLFSKEKLDTFNRLTNDILEPFNQIDIKWRKTDEFIFILGLLASITNPTVPVGMLLKELGSAAAPNAIGKSVDVVTTLAGAGISKSVVGGLNALLPTLGSAGASITRDLLNGRLDISLIPKFQPTIYTFCNRTTDNKRGLVQTFVSPILLGNKQWIVRDYVDQLSPNMRINAKGTIGKTGANFQTIKQKVNLPNTVAPLDEDSIAQICDVIIEVFGLAKSYAKAFPQYYRSYNTHFTAVSNTVSRKLDGNLLRDTYVRYTYRNAMNLILGSMWRNCFGADNQYLRYLLSISKQLLRYCEQSLISNTETNTDKETP